MLDCEIVIDNAIPKVSDFTAYLRAEEPNEKIFCALSNHSPLQAAFDTEAGISSVRNEPAIRARIHGCKCFRGKYWSLTVRKDSKSGQADFVPLRYSGSSKYIASEESADSFLNSFHDICEILYPLIFSRKKNRTTGMVIITGGTGCGKSNIVRGLIDMFLRDTENLRVWSERRRVPHLITYEDPIEKELIGEGDLQDGDQWVNYTPRQKDVDVDSLSSAIKSALRQTPAAFYVGEVRDVDEWKSLLDFAGTGHLIFTTAHAGSLIEAMGKILSATDSTNASTRAIVAERLAGLVHLQSDQITAVEKSFEPAVPMNVVVPSLWRHSTVGAKALMAEGQASLMPNAGRGHEGHSCFGRTWFGAELAKHFRRKRSLSKYEAGLRRRCIEWDLEGL